MDPMDLGRNDEEDRPVEQRKELTDLLIDMRKSLIASRLAMKLS